jgi:hypothetical protein
MEPNPKELVPRNFVHVDGLPASVLYLIWHLYPRPRRNPPLRHHFVSHQKISSISGHLEIIFDRMSPIIK